MGAAVALSVLGAAPADAKLAEGGGGAAPPATAQEPVETEPSSATSGHPTRGGVKVPPGRGPAAPAGTTSPTNTSGSSGQGGGGGAPANQGQGQPPNQGQGQPPNQGQGQPPNRRRTRSYADDRRTPTNTGTEAPDDAPDGVDPDLEALLNPGNTLDIQGQDSGAPNGGHQPTGKKNRKRPPPPAGDQDPVVQPEGAGQQDPLSGAEEENPWRDFYLDNLPPEVRKKVRIGHQAEPPVGTGEWFDDYATGLGGGHSDAPKPRRRPKDRNGMTPYEFDHAMGEFSYLYGPAYSPGHVEGARRRLQRPVTSLTERIAELDDLIEDQDQNPLTPDTPAQIGRLSRLRNERALRATQLQLYGSGHCDYRCDVEAPYEPTGDEDDPMDEAAEDLGADATRREVLVRAQEMFEERQAELEKLQREQEDSGANYHTVLDVGGLLGPVGPVFDGVNAVAYGAEGDWGNAGFSVFGAVPLFGDAAKGAKLLRQAQRAAELANDADKVYDAARLAKTDPSKLADEFAQRNLNGKFDSSDGSGDALAGIFARTQSGTPPYATVRGMFNPSHTRGHATELRTLIDLSRRSDVASIKAIPSGPGGRTPDFVVTLKSGKVQRVEVTTVTGAGPGRQLRGIGRAKPPTTRQISAAVRRKVRGRSQFNSTYEDVPEGGALVVGLRGGADMGAEAAKVMTRATGALSKAKVDQVTFTLSNGRAVTYVLRHGVYKLKVKL